MAIDPFQSFNPAVLTTGMDAVTQTIYYVLITALIGAILWGSMYLLSFKHLVRVRQKTAGGYIVIDTKAREFKTKEGITKWRILKYIKTAIVAPTNNCLEITGKGKYSAECQRALDGTITWSVKDDTGKVTGEVTTEERLITLSEMRRAEEYKKQKLSDKLFQLAPIMALLIILVLFMVFFSDVVQPTKELGDRLINAVGVISESNDKLAAACLDRPVLSGGVGSGGVIPGGIPN